MAELQLKSVEKTYGNGFKAVHSIDLEVEEGEFMVLVGPSGCAKSTTLRMIAGLETITGGEVQIGNQVVNDLVPGKRGIAMVFQNYALYPHMSVYQNMSFGLRLAKAKKEFIQERVNETAEILQISELLERKPKALSGGQRQRVCIARALALKPELVIADEAVSALDVSVQAQVMNLMLELQQEMGLSYLFISHDLAVVERIAHRVAVMYLGQIVELGSREQVFRDPRHSYTKRLLGAVPIADPRQRTERPLLTGEIPSPVWPAGEGPALVTCTEVEPGHQVADE